MNIEGEAIVFCNTEDTCRILGLQGENMTQEQMLMGIHLYLILSKIDEKEQDGKTGRKRLMQALKRQLAIEGRKDAKSYLALVEASDMIVERAKDELSEGNIPINPGWIFKIILFRYPELMDPYGLKMMHVNNLQNAYRNELWWTSIKVGNRLVNQTKLYIKEINNV